MKKLSFLLGVLFVASLSLTSCKKDWNCDCTVDGETETIATYTDVNKGDAKDACEVWNGLAKAVGGSCEIKKK